jgi:hypothetical protein
MIIDLSFKIQEINSRLLTVATTEEHARLEGIRDALLATLYLLRDGKTEKMEVL